jgi:hypothetical protein
LPVSSLGVAVKVTIHSLSGVRLTGKVESGAVVNFDVKARMEEKERRSNQVNVGFVLNVGTKPSVVKFEVEGEAVLKGKDEEIKKMLEVDPETQIPFVFQRVYQHVFMSMYLLATLIDAPYPPPNLLYSNQQQIPIAQTEVSTLAAEEQAVPTEEEAAASEEKQPLQPAPSTEPEEETTTQPTPVMPPQEETTPIEEEQTAEAATEVQQNNVAQQNKEEPTPQA